MAKKKVPTIPTLDDIRELKFHPAPQLREAMIRAGIRSQKIIEKHRSEQQAALGNVLKILVR